MAYYLINTSVRNGKTGVDRPMLDGKSLPVNVRVPLSDEVLDREYDRLRYYQEIGSLEVRDSETGASVALPPREDPEEEKKEEMAPVLPLRPVKPLSLEQDECVFQMPISKLCDLIESRRGKP